MKQRRALPTSPLFRLPLKEVLGASRDANAADPMEKAKKGPVRARVDAVVHAFTDRLLARLLYDREQLLARLAARWARINGDMATEYQDILLLLRIEEQLIFLARDGGRTEGREATR